MFKRKYLLKDIEVEGKVANQFFTDDSYIIVDYPSVREKMAIKDKITKAGENNVDVNMDIMASLVCEVNCKTIDCDEEIKTFEELTCFPDGEIVFAWLAKLAEGGFVPKKI